VASGAGTGRDTAGATPGASAGVPGFDATGTAAADSARVATLIWPIVYVRANSWAGWLNVSSMPPSS